MEPEGSQVPDTCPYPESARASPWLRILLGIINHKYPNFAIFSSPLLRFYRIRGTSWLAEQSLDPKEGFCYMQLVANLLTEVLCSRIFITNSYMLFLYVYQSKYVIIIR
jgi:hypothetical protein